MSGLFTQPHRKKSSTPKLIAVLAVITISILSIRAYLSSIVEPKASENSKIEAAHQSKNQNNTATADSGSKSETSSENESNLVNNNSDSNSSSNNENSDSNDTASSNENSTQLAESGNDNRSGNGTLKPESYIRNSDKLPNNQINLSSPTARNLESANSSTTVTYDNSDSVSPDRKTTYERMERNIQNLARRASQSSYRNSENNQSEKSQPQDTKEVSTRPHPPRTASRSENNDDVNKSTEPRQTNADSQIRSVIQDTTKSKQKNSRPRVTVKSKPSDPSNKEIIDLIRKEETKFGGVKVAD